jgi:subtilisin family serine protease
VRVRRSLTTAPDLCATSPLALVGLDSLIARHEGRPDVRVGLVDGPVWLAHPDLEGAHVHDLADGAAVCSEPSGAACAHGTFVAGILVARRGSAAPAICPGCTLLVRPIFRDAGTAGASVDEVGEAIVTCVEAGARVVNLSAAVGQATTPAAAGLRHVLDHVAPRALVVAAAGNQGKLGSSEITRHPGVVGVVGFDGRGRPMASSNLSRSIAIRGLGAPGEGIVSLAAADGTTALDGTSFATAFVTGAIALLWSLFPDATASQMRAAIVPERRTRTIVPPLLDADVAQLRLAAILS